MKKTAWLAMMVAAYERHKRHANYEAYQEEMETLNKERSAQGLAPEPVLSFKEWKAERSKLKLPAEKAP